MASIEIKGIIGDDYGYSQFLTDYAKAGDEPIRLMIDSPGGAVGDGMDIANFISSHQDRFISVTNSGDIASIAALIFIAVSREKRFFDISKGLFLIHNPFVDPFSLAFSDTTAEGLALISDELVKIEDEYAKFFVKNTGADVDVVRGMMKINQPLTEEQLIALNVATIYKYQAVAFIKSENKMKSDEVKEIVREESKGIFESFKAWFKKTTKFVAIILTDATGVQVEFPDVAEGNEPMVGDVARFMDGTIPNGEMLMADGNTYEFENGVLMEIKLPETVEALPPMEETMPAPDAEVNPELEALKAENESLKNEIIQIKAQIKTQTITPAPVEVPALAPVGESDLVRAAREMKAQLFK